MRKILSFDDRDRSKYSHLYSDWHNLLKIFTDYMKRSAGDPAITKSFRDQFDKLVRQTFFKIDHGAHLKYEEASVAGQSATPLNKKGGYQRADGTQLLKDTLARIQEQTKAPHVEAVNTLMVLLYFKHNPREDVTIVHSDKELRSALDRNEPNLLYIHSHSKAFNEDVRFMEGIADIVRENIATSLDDLPIEQANYLPFIKLLLGLKTDFTDECKPHIKLKGLQILRQFATTGYSKAVETLVEATSNEKAALDNFTKVQKAFSDATPEKKEVIQKDVDAAKKAHETAKFKLEIATKAVNKAKDGIKDVTNDLKKFITELEGIDCFDDPIRTVHPEKAPASLLRHNEEEAERLRDRVQEISMTLQKKDLTEDQRKKLEKERQTKGAEKSKLMKAFKNKGMQKKLFSCHIDTLVNYLQAISEIPLINKALVIDTIDVYPTNNNYILISSKAHKQLGHMQYRGFNVNPVEFANNINRETLVSMFRELRVSAEVRKGNPDQSSLVLSRDDINLTGDSAADRSPISTAKSTPDRLFSPSTLPPLTPSPQKSEGSSSRKTAATHKSPDGDSLPSADTHPSPDFMSVALSPIARSSSLSLAKVSEGPSTAFSYILKDPVYQRLSRIVECTPKDIEDKKRLCFPHVLRNILHSLTQIEPEGVHRIISLSEDIITLTLGIIGDALNLYECGDFKANYRFEAAAMNLSILFQLLTPYTEADLRAKLDNSFPLFKHFADKNPDLSRTSQYVPNGMTNMEILSLFSVFIKKSDTTDEPVTGAAAGAGAAAGGSSASAVEVTDSSPFALLNILCQQSSYYEFSGSLRSELPFVDRGNLKVLETQEAYTPDARVNIIVADPTPNNATLTLVDYMEIASVIKKSLSVKTDKRPLLTFIDFTCCEPDDERLKIILNDPEIVEAINAGTLILSFVKSEAKFGQFGLDFVTGGRFEVFCHREKHADFVKLLEIMPKLPRSNVQTLTLLMQAEQSEYIRFASYNQSLLYFELLSKLDKEQLMVSSLKEKVDNKEEPDKPPSTEYMPFSPPPSIKRRTDNLPTPLSTLSPDSTYSRAGFSPSRPSPTPEEAKIRTFQQNLSELSADEMSSEVIDTRCTAPFSVLSTNIDEKSVYLSLNLDKFTPLFYKKEGAKEVMDEKFRMSLNNSIMTLIIKKAKALGLTVSTRSSFGFFDSHVDECGNSIRIKPGALISSDDCKKMATAIHEAMNDIDHFFTTYQNEHDLDFKALTRQSHLDTKQRDALRQKFKEFVEPPKPQVKGKGKKKKKKKKEEKKE